jgi:hypothetical protein
VDTQLVREIPADRAYTATRARLISLLGPVTVAAGFVWALFQPYRITLLHPHAEGFWWLAVEPPLLVVLAGVVFAVFVARPLIADLEEEDERGAP